jgi:hypothetical protein
MTMAGSLVKAGSAFLLVLLAGGVLWVAALREPLPEGDGPGAARAPEPPKGPAPARAPSAAQVEAPAAVPADPGDPAPAGADPRFGAMSHILGRPGTLTGRVYAVTIPRDDFDLYTKEGWFPPEAGIASIFYFHPCDCGAMSVIGQFVVRDYETNDVIDALREGNIRVASVAPMLLEDDPKLMVIRFQGGGGHAKLAETLRAALAWTGDARTAPPTAPAAGE